jgi:hypothetical protein
MADDSPPAPDPAEAFALIGNEIRADILRVLGQDPHTGISFSELRSRVDEDIDSGQFNYHLDKLVGHFVLDGEDGYELRPAGLSLYRAIRAGSFDRRTTRDPFDAGFDCFFCGAAVEASYDDGLFRLACPDCAHEFTHTMIPPSAVESVAADALLDHVSQYSRHELRAHLRGVCPTCVNPVEQSLVAGEEVWSEGAEHFDWWARYHCDHCGRSQYTSIGMAMLYEPAVIAFFHEHDVDVTRRPYWEFEFVMTDHCTTVRETDPFEAAVEVSHGGEILELVVDEDLAVVETTRA